MGGIVDLLIFDMDGVLIDVSKSYRETIRRTVHIYLEKCLGFQIGKRDPISKEDISLFKSIGGFNNDWDLTSGLLLYLLSISGIPPSRKKRRFSSIEEVVLYLKKRASKSCQNAATLFQKKNLSQFLKKAKSFGDGLKGVRRALAGSWDGWVYGSGNLDEENLVKRIFQEVYLGSHFTSHYHLRPIFYRGKGLHLQEKLLIPRKILSFLRKKLHMGIASGRPRFEAELALKRFRLLPYFDSVVTLDECIEEEACIFRTTGKQISLLKPRPYSLLRVVQEIDIPRPECGYIGDVVDDMLAAQAAKKKLQMVAIAFLGGRSKRKAIKESLFRAGADCIIENPEDLLQLVSSSLPPRGKGNTGV